MKKKVKIAAPATPAIVAESVSKTFRPKSANPVHALNNVSFEVAGGEIVGLIGPNGAGKSTLLRILLGFMNADGGNVSLFGQHPESLIARKSIGYQGDSQFRSNTLTVRTFLDLHAVLLGLDDTADHVDSLLKQFNLPTASQFSLSSLSKGMRQKLELVLAFLGSPKIVFLDEPTASMDPPSVFELRDFLEQRKDSGTTVFFSSHNLTEVENVCDRVLFIKEGSIVAQYDMEKAKRGFLEKVFRKHLIQKNAA